MKLSWKWKLILINGICQGYFFLFTACSLIVGFGTTLPYVLGDNPQTLFILKISTLYISFNVFANYFCIRYTATYSHFSTEVKETARDEPENVIDNGSVNSSNVGTTLLHSDQAYELGNGENRNKIEKHEDFEEYATIDGWSKCIDCAGFVPPRAKHCILCNACILKRDHHCFFAGCCVGFHNQRYFTMFCMYCAMGAFFSSLVTHFYLWDHFEGTKSIGIFAYILPATFWFWAYGGATGHVVVMTLFLYWNCLTAIMGFYYFAVQVFLILRGQTKFEVLKNINFYRGHFPLNIKSVLGNYWFLVPFIPVPTRKSYYGDGINWEEFVPEKWK